MTSCNHHPIFRIRMLFSRAPKFICKNCGAEIEMNSQTKMVGRVINALTIGILVYMALSGDFTKSGTNAMLVYFAEMAGIVAAYLLLQALLMNLGKFQEVEQDDASFASSNSNASDSSTSDSDPASSEPKPEYSQEQLELMALYESYAQKDREESGSVIEQAPVIVEAPIEDTCEHYPAKSWKNFVPGVYDFKCEHCGKPITFTVERKKSLNLVLFAFSAIVLFASFQGQNLLFWQLILLTLAILAVCSVVQYIFVKKSRFVIKEMPGK